MYLCHRFIEKSACPQHITVWGWVNKEWRKNFQPFFCEKLKSKGGQKSLMKWPLSCGMFTRMMRANTTSAKVDKRQVAQAEFQKVIENACVAGFHGSASVTITVQDGHIQYTKVAVERMVR